MQTTIILYKLHSTYLWRNRTGRVPIFAVKFAIHTDSETFKHKLRIQNQIVGIRFLWKFANCQVTSKKIKAHTFQGWAQCLGLSTPRFILSGPGAQETLAQRLRIGFSTSLSQWHSCPWWKASLNKVRKNPSLLSSLCSTYILNSALYILNSALWEFIGAYYLYTGVAVLGFLFFWWVLPETKGKSLEEVETLFSRPWFFHRKKNNQREDIEYLIMSSHSPNSSCGSEDWCPVFLPLSQLLAHLVQQLRNQLGNLHYASMSKLFTIIYAWIPQCFHPICVSS